jgi:TRAP-type C4-dicarboxylate transport system permease small subunit
VLDRLERGFLALNRWLIVAMLGAMSLIVFTNVVLRYSASYSIEWAEEVARHLMIWLTFLGIGPVLRHGGHIAIENLQDALPGRVAVLMRALVALLLCALLVVFVLQGLEYMDRTQYQRTPATQISFAWIYAALPLGAAFALIHGLLVVRGYVRERRFAPDAQFDASASASL